MNTFDIKRNVCPIKTAVIPLGSHLRVVGEQPRKFLINFSKEIRFFPNISAASKFLLGPLHTIFISSSNNAKLHADGQNYVD